MCKVFCIFYCDGVLWQVQFIVQLWWYVTYLLILFSTKFMLKFFESCEFLMRHSADMSEADGKINMDFVGMKFFAEIS